MVVKEIMKTDVATCTPETDIETAIRLMERHECGFLPVVGTHGNLAGVITDRDICIALATHKHRSATHIAVREAMTRPVFNCFVDENLKIVLGTMATHRIRRLPVRDKIGHLQGVVSIDDIVLAPHRRGAPTPDEIVQAYRSICAKPTLEPAFA